MNIVAQDIENGRAFLPGLFKFNTGEQFKQALISLSESELNIYDDNAPDAINGDDWHYNIKYRFPLSDVVKVVNEILYKQPELEGLHRLEINLKNSKDPFYFYYYASDKKTSNNFLAGLKYYGVNTVNRRVELVAQY